MGALAEERTGVGRISMSSEEEQLRDMFNPDAACERGGDMSVSTRGTTVSSHG
jgi:hypothetical protein